MTIDVFPANYHAGRLVLDPLTVTLRELNEVLNWENPTVAEEERTFVEQPTVVLIENLPEDPNAWGAKHQRVVVVFSYVDRLTETEVQNLTATIAKTGGGGAKALGKVTGFKERYEASRFLPTSSVRSRALNVVSMSGRLVANPSQDLTTRRTVLLLAKTDMQTTVNGQHGTLSYIKPVGGNAFKQVVRIRSFEAQVDQAVNGID